MRQCSRPSSTLHSETSVALATTVFVTIEVRHSRIEVRMPQTKTGRITLLAGILLLIVCAPFWVKSLGYAFAYSAWAGLDPKKFPIAAAQSSAREWMVVALAIQVSGIVLTAISVRRIERPLVVFIFICLVPASFLPTWIFIWLLMLKH